MDDFVSVLGCDRCRPMKAGVSVISFISELDAKGSIGMVDGVFSMPEGLILGDEGTMIFFPARSLNCLAIDSDWPASPYGPYMYGPYMHRIDTTAVRLYYLNSDCTSRAPAI